MYGIMLELPVAELDAIKGTTNRVAICFQSVLQEWLLKKTSPRTKANLLKALRGNNLKEIKLAEKVEGLSFLFKEIIVYYYSYCFVYIAISCFSL